MVSWPEIFHWSRGPSCWSPHPMSWSTWGSILCMPISIRGSIMSSKYATTAPTEALEVSGKAGPAAPQETTLQGSSLTREALRRLRRDRMAVISAIFLVAVALVSLFAPLLAPKDPTAVDLSQRLLPPGTPGYLLGTDQVGRDMLSRLIWGGRISLLIGFSAVMVAMFLGVLIGLIAGYYGGRLESLTMRFIDILMAFPAILLAITIVASLGPGLRNSMLAVSLVGIPFYVRIVRGSVLALREQEFINAARLVGLSHSRILYRHVLPNTLAPL